MSDLASPSAPVPQVCDTSRTTAIWCNRFYRDLEMKIVSLLERRKIAVSDPASVSLEPKNIDFVETTRNQRDHYSDEVAGKPS